MSYVHNWLGKSEDLTARHNITNEYGEGEVGKIENVYGGSLYGACKYEVPPWSVKCSHSYEYIRLLVLLRTPYSHAQAGMKRALWSDRA